MCASVLLSLKIAVLSTIAATIIGTMAAFGLVRHDFRGKGLANILIFVPMATPEVVAVPRCWCCSSTSASRWVRRRSGSRTRCSA